MLLNRTTVITTFASYIRLFCITLTTYIEYQGNKVRSLANLSAKAPFIPNDARLIEMVTGLVTTSQLLANMADTWAVTSILDQNIGCRGGRPRLRGEILDQKVYVDGITLLGCCGAKAGCVFENW